jgi:hypothetical protein
MKRLSWLFIVPVLALLGMAPRAEARIKIEWTHPDGCSTRMCYQVDAGPLHCYTLHVYMFCGGTEPSGPHFADPQPAPPVVAPATAGRYDVPQDQ